MTEDAMLIDTGGRLGKLFDPLQALVKHLQNLDKVWAVAEAGRSAA